VLASRDIERKALINGCTTWESAPAMMITVDMISRRLTGSSRRRCAFTTFTTYTGHDINAEGAGGRKEALEVARFSHQREGPERGNDMHTCKMQRDGVRQLPREKQDRKAVGS
jgi:hypothetical protein